MLNVHILEAVVRRCSVVRAFLEISQISQDLLKIHSFIKKSL